MMNRINVPIETFLVCDAQMGMVYSYYIKILYSPLIRLKFL